MRRRTPTALRPLLLAVLLSLTFASATATASAHTTASATPTASDTATATATASAPATATPTAQVSQAPRTTHHDRKAPASFVELRDIDPTIIEDIRYATPHNFTGVPVTGYTQPLCLLTRSTAKALHRAQRQLLRRGYSLKVYDCFRPQRAVDHFVRWAEDLSDQRMKAEFYPRVDKTRLFADGYIAEKSGHSRGSTLDLSFVRLPARPTRPYVPGEALTSCYSPKAERFPDMAVDTGTGFDCFDTLAHTEDPRITGSQRAHRELLTTTLEREGFTNLPEEWWHFTHQPEQYPDTYFDFPVSRHSLTSRH
ncbi:M15 family metallopeptidase [Streptomyces sp. NPDC004959]|uniref:M15 family metallopeptidase n=1 Tax=unclassified Streptomyces TaxID=2593676 RepID=UPI0004C4F465|nr:M15 family metallopeptidase [Streptomyces sp. NRRL F-5630]